MYFKKPEECESVAFPGSHIQILVKISLDEHRLPGPMAMKYSKDFITHLFSLYSVSNSFNIQRIQFMHILPFLGSTTSSILGTGVGSSMSFVRSSCSSSSFCPLLFPYKAACLKEIIYSYNHQTFSPRHYSSLGSRIKGLG